MDSETAQQTMKKNKDFNTSTLASSKHQQNKNAVIDLIDEEEEERK